MRLKRIAAISMVSMLPLFSAGPASAAYDAALLAAILEQAIAQLLQQQQMNSGIEGVDDSVQQVDETIKRESEANARAIMNGQIDIYNQQVSRDQQASTFCQDDQALPTRIGRVSTKATYVRQGRLYNKYNSVAATREPAKFTAKTNQDLKNSVTASCNPHLQLPVGKKDIDGGSNPMSCTDEQIDIATAVVSGRKPAPQPPAALKDSDVGEVLQAEIDTYNSRMSAVDAAIGNAMSEETDAKIAAYQKLFASPTIEEINAMSGSGGAARDMMVMMQLQNQLLLHTYIEMVEIRRLEAIRVAQGEEDHRKQISALIQNAARQ
jgi:hypothetical protein